jgi:hypothetical protein
MAYNPDPFDNALAKFFPGTGGSYRFAPPHSALSIPISDDDYDEAEDRISTYSTGAKFVTLAIVGCGGLWAAWKAMSGDSYLTFLLAIVALFPIAVLSNIIAMRSALRPLNRRLRDHARNDLGWKRKGFRRALRDSRINKWQLGFLTLFSLAILPFGIHNYQRRSAILDHGTRILATVYRSDDDNAKHTCVVKYRYSLSGASYHGDIIGCDIMRAHAVGVDIPIRVIPNDPGYSIAEGEGFWTADFAAPFIISGLWAFVLLMFIPAARSYAPPPN